MQTAEKIYTDLAPTHYNEKTLDLKICWFCDKPEAEAETAAEIHIFKDQNTHYGLTGIEYEYLVLSRKIPCCRNCHRTHKRASGWSRAMMILVGIGGFLAGLILPFVITLKLNIEPTGDFNGIVLFAMFGGSILGIALGYLLGRKIAFSFSPDTKPQTYAKQHPLIKSLLDQGWRFGKPV